LPHATHFWENCSRGCRRDLPVRNYEIWQLSCHTPIETSAGKLVADTDSLEVDKLNQYLEGMKKA